MTIQDIIAKKRDNEKLSKEEIFFFVNEYSRDNIPDYQMSALLMAIYINGMDIEEITNLTIAMSNSSDKYDLSQIGKCIVDKHSTGGVGDKVTLIVLPIVASLGISIAKMSGRGLGFTGGTIDKLESIENFNVDIPYEQFIKQVKNINMAIISQSKDIVIADKKMYALRDVTATTSSNALISSSIMSKKLASGADKIVLDVTCGSGAFMNNIEDAKSLAKIMVDIGKKSGKETVAIVTDMSEPLGKKVGNRLEIEEVIEFLTSTPNTFYKQPKDIIEVVLEIGSYMIKLGGYSDNIEYNKEKMIEAITDGSAYNKFLQFIQAQEGVVEKNTVILKKEANLKHDICALEQGYISKISGEDVGKALVALGGGREKKTDELDYSVGFVFEKKVLDKVNNGDVICTVLYNDKNKLEKAIEYINKAIKIEEKIDNKSNVSNILGVIK